MKTIAFYIILLCIALQSEFVFGQVSYNIYDKNNWGEYFDDPTKFNQFYNSYINMKDSLPDGNYCFYSYQEEDSLNKKVSHYKIKGQYKHNVKNGKFEHIDYRFDIRNKCFTISAYNTATYIDGELNGKKISYSVINNDAADLYIMNEYCEYIDGKKHGIELVFSNGFIVEINHYNNGSLIKTETNMHK